MPEQFFVTARVYCYCPNYGVLKDFSLKLKKRNRKKIRKRKKKRNIDQVEVIKAKSEVTAKEQLEGL